MEIRIIEGEIDNAGDKDVIVCVCECALANGMAHILSKLVYYSEETLFYPQLQPFLRTTTILLLLENQKKPKAEPNVNARQSPISTDDKMAAMGMVMVVVMMVTYMS